MSWQLEDAQALEQAWQAYKENGDERAREALVIAYAPLVKHLAGRLRMGLPSMVEIDDLIGSGMLGLLDAVDKYIPDMGVRFETYARMRIRGAMLDGLRIYDWAPRSVRRKSRQLTEVIGELENTLGRSATDLEIAGAMGIAVAELEELLRDLRGVSLLSLDQPLESGDDRAGALGSVLVQSLVMDPPDQLERQELLDELAEAIDKLPERERLLLALYYHEELTLKEIGVVLGVSESRACQLHTRAILRLRARLEKVGACTSEACRV